MLGEEKKPRSYVFAAAQPNRETERFPRARDQMVLAMVKRRKRRRKGKACLGLRDGFVRRESCTGPRIRTSFLVRLGVPCPCCIQTPDSSRMPLLCPACIWAFYVRSQQGWRVDHSRLCARLESKSYEMCSYKHIHIHTGVCMCVCISTNSDMSL